MNFCLVITTAPTVPLADISYAEMLVSYLYSPILSSPAFQCRKRLTTLISSRRQFNVSDHVINKTNKKV